MKISLENTGKKYNKEWIFRNLNLEINSPNSYVISGANGSGKSTLLKTISGFETPSEGKVIYQNEKVINAENIYKSVSYTSPYISVFEDYTIKELFSFYTKLKPLRNNVSLKEFLEIIELAKAKDKEIKNFSSGMKQRVKLGLAILSETPILLLDEPTSNLDANAIRWYQNLIQNNLEDRIVFVASNNQKDESFFCENEIKIEDYK
ncbi:MAG: ABC transporter ATP-binding protein [Flavobacteriales bacterium]